MKKKIIFIFLLGVLFGCHKPTNMNYNIALLYDSGSDYKSQLYLENAKGDNNIVKINKTGIAWPIVYNKKYNTIYSSFDISTMGGCDSDIIETNLTTLKNKTFDWNDWGDKCSISSFTSQDDYLYASDNVNGKGNLLQIDLKNGQKKREIINGSPVYLTMQSKDDLLFVMYSITDNTESDAEDSGIDNDKIYMTNFKSIRKTLALDYDEETVKDIKIYKNILYISTMSKNKQNRYFLYKYDIKNEKIEKIRKLDNPDIVVYQDNLYSINTKEIMIYNLKTKKETKFKADQKKVKVSLGNVPIISNDLLYIYYAEDDINDPNGFSLVYESGDNVDCQKGYIDVYDLKKQKLIRTINPYDKKYETNGKCFVSFAATE